MEPIICPHCKVYVESLVDASSTDDPGRRYFYRCPSCGGTAPQPIDIAKRVIAHAAELDVQIPQATADAIARNIIMALGAHYSIALTEVER